MHCISNENAGFDAATQTNWAVLVRSNNSDSTEFIEIRQNGCAVWCARGKAYTSGLKELVEFQSKADAEAFFRQTIADDQAQGFDVLHIGQTGPGKLIFNLLENAIVDGAREAYLQICGAHPEESISGFALFTDFDGMTICPVAMADSTFDGVDEEADYYRASPCEWPYTSYDVGLLLAYRIILVASYEHHEIPFETEVPEYFDQFFEACTRALERLDRDGLFGTGAGRENFLLLIGLSDGGPTKATVKRLNPERLYQRYAHCYDD